MCDTVNKTRPARIAVDGPSGSGKSTLARKLASLLGFVYVDTGAMYRSVGLFALRAGADPKNGAAVEALLPRITVELRAEADGQHVYLCGEDVTGLIRTEQISMAASAVAVIPKVRSFLTDRQKEMAAAGGIVMDGRDIGTVVIPDAECKIFLITSPEERARRRTAELLERGEKADYETVLADIIARDKNDSGRAVAPLKPAADAVHLDNSGFEMADTLREALRIVREKTGLSPAEV